MKLMLELDGIIDRSLPFATTLGQSAYPHWFTIYLLVLWCKLGKILEPR